jgi:D-glycero-alpha-D-manno-heptose 1-phosphate guanylyltransferase
MNAIILCGGLSTRLGDITKTIPKILLEIGDKTVLDWQLDSLKRLGVTEVILAAGHLAKELYDTVGESYRGMTLIYSIEDKKLGTGGAIKHALSYVSESRKDMPTIVLNGDVLTTIDLSDMASYLKPESDGIILGAYVDDVASYGTLEYTDQYELIAFKEKTGKHEPGYQNGGIYLMNSSFQNYFPHMDSFSIEYDVFPFVKKLFVYESNKPWIDIGVPERLAWARENWARFLV